MFCIERSGTLSVFVNSSIKKEDIPLYCILLIPEKNLQVLGFPWCFPCCFLQAEWPQIIGFLPSNSSVTDRSPKATSAQLSWAPGILWYCWGAAPWIREHKDGQSDFAVCLFYQSNLKCQSCSHPIKLHIFESYCPLKICINIPCIFYRKTDKTHLQKNGIKQLNSLGERIYAGQFWSHSFSDIR